jgi:hypothetical protein
MAAMLFFILQQIRMNRIVIFKISINSLIQNRTLSVDSDTSTIHFHVSDTLLLLIYEARNYYVGVAF